MILRENLILRDYLSGKRVVDNGICPVDAGIVRRRKRELVALFAEALYRSLRKHARVSNGTAKYLRAL